MSRFAQSLYEAEFEKEEREFRNEMELNRFIADQERRADLQKKRDKNYDWKNEEGDEY